MLISKPDIKTLSALGAFIFVDFTLLAYLLSTQLKGEKTPLYIYLLILLLLVVGLVVFVKVIRGYKTLTIDKKKFKVKYALSYKNFEAKLNTLEYWKETIIQTKKEPFKELKLKFTQGNIVKITNQENTNYNKVYQYIERNAAKKKVTSQNN